MKKQETGDMAKKIATKKAVVFIVEGKSDKDALERIFKVIYKL